MTYKQYATVCSFCKFDADDGNLGFPLKHATCSCNHLSAIKPDEGDFVRVQYGYIGFSPEMSAFMWKSTITSFQSCKYCN